MSNCTLQEGGSYEKYANDIYCNSSVKTVNRSSYFLNDTSEERGWFGNMEKKINEDLREEVKARASRHRDYYKSLCDSGDSSNTDAIESVHGEQMAEPVSFHNISSDTNNKQNVSKFQDYCINCFLFKLL